MIVPFIRKSAYMALLGGISKSEFHEKQKEGLISQPDGWLGPRSPIWKETTAQADMERILAVPKPIETRPKRRRSPNKTKGHTMRAPLKRNPAGANGGASGNFESADGRSPICPPPPLRQADHPCAICGAYATRSADGGKDVALLEHDPHRDKDLKPQTTELVARPIMGPVPLLRRPWLPLVSA